jgi:hypothetical protein
MSALISTAGDLITFALRASGINGVGQTPMAEDSNTGLELLRNLIAQWQKKRWMEYVLQEVSVPSSTGAQFYTIGPGQDFDCARPDYIAAAYIRILGGSPGNLVDIPIQIIHAREDYAGISVKTLQSMPAVVWYESQWPTGRVYWWPVPPGGMYGLYLTVKSPLPTYSTLTDPLNLPPEYNEALIWSLCVRLQMSYGLQARPDQVAAMNQAMQVLRQANLQIAELAIPAPGGRRGSDISLVGHGLGRAFVLDQGAVL